MFRVHQPFRNISDNLPDGDFICPSCRADGKRSVFVKKESRTVVPEALRVAKPDCMPCRVSIFEFESKLQKVDLFGRDGRITVAVFGGEPDVRISPPRGA
jgi:hypothetical protein